MSAVQGALFACCPACRRNPVADPREPCAECLAAFGPMLRRGERQVSAEEFTADLADGARAVAAVMAERRKWLSPVCVITPNRHRNHTACNFTLCTCKCHKRKNETATTAGED